LSYKPGFAINPLKFVNGITKYALSKKLKIFEHTLVDKINKNKYAIKLHDYCENKKYCKKNDSK